MKYVFYIICQLTTLSTETLEIIRAILPFGNSVIFQVDSLNATMKELLSCLCTSIPNACIQYLSEEMEQDIAREDRQFLFELERTGIGISVKRDCSVGKSFYARRKRHQNHIKSADYVLIIYDKMTTEIRNAIKFAEENAAAYKIICCSEL